MKLKPNGSVLAAVCSLMLLSIVNISAANDAYKEVYEMPKPVIENYNSIDFAVYPKIELISIVQSISKYPEVFGFLMVKDTFQYKLEVSDKFGPFKEHPLVKMFDGLSLKPGMLNFNAPSFIMLYLDNNLNIRTDIILDEFVVKRVGGVDSLKKFSNLLKEFARETLFNKFFEEHRAYYEKVIQNTIKEFGAVNYVTELEEFYGLKQKGYNICLVSLYSFVGFGNSIVYKTGVREVFDVMGTRSIANGIPSFGDENYLKYMTRHEFSHPFINPLTEKYWDYIKDYSKNYDSIPDNAKKGVCGDWHECINEFTIRAITTYLALKENKELGQKFYEREKSKGVINIDDLITQIEYYESNRKLYPTIDSFYKQILDVFKKL